VWVRVERWTQKERQALSSAGKTGKNTAAQHERKKKKQASLRGATRRGEGRKQRKKGPTQKKGASHSLERETGKTTRKAEGETKTERKTEDGGRKRRNAAHPV